MNNYSKKFFNFTVHIISLFTLAVILSACQGIYTDIEADSFSIKVDSSITNGKLTTTSTEKKAGEVVLLDYAPDYGYRLKPGSLSYIVNGTSIPIKGKRFFMPAGDVQLTCQFESDIDATLSMSDDAITMVANDKYQLSVDAQFGVNLKGRRIVWASGDEKLCTVDETGFIYTHNIGATTITATLENTSVSLSIPINIIKSNFTFDTATGMITGYQANSLTGRVLTVPNYINNTEVKGIGDGVFKDSVDFDIVVLPDSCVSVGEGAFKNSSVEMVKIYGECNLGEEAFANCEKLTSFSSDVNFSVAENTFAESSALEKIEMPKEIVNINRSKEEWEAFSSLLGTKDSHKISTFIPYDDGEIICGKGWAEHGETVSVVVNPKKGFTYRTGTLVFYNSEGARYPIESSSFEMPNYDITLTCEFDTTVTDLIFVHLMDDGTEDVAHGNICFEPRGSNYSLQPNPHIGYSLVKVEYTLEGVTKTATYNAKDKLYYVPRKSTVTMTWNKNTHQIVLYTGRDTLASITISVLHGGTLPLLDINENPITHKTYSTHTFLGYYTAPNGQGIQLYDANLNPDSTYQCGENPPKELFSHWKANARTISFYDGDVLLSTQLVQYGEALSFVEIPTSPTKIFMGFYDIAQTMYVDQNGNGVRLFDVAEDLDLYARWDSLSRLFKVEYPGVNGTEEISVVFKLNNPLPTLTLPGFSNNASTAYFPLGIYSKTADGEWGTMYYDENFSSSYYGTEDLAGETLYVRYGEYIRFTLDYANGILEPDVITLAPGAKMPILPQVDTNNDESFLGFYTKDSSGKFTSDWCYDLWMTPVSETVLASMHGKTYYANYGKVSGVSFFLNYDPWRGKSANVVQVNGYENLPLPPITINNTERQAMLQDGRNFVGFYAINGSRTDTDLSSSYYTYVQGSENLKKSKTYTSIDWHGTTGYAHYNFKANMNVYRNEDDTEPVVVFKDVWEGSSYPSISSSVLELLKPETGYVLVGLYTKNKNGELSPYDSGCRRHYYESSSKLLSASANVDFGYKYNERPPKEIDIYACYAPDLEYTLASPYATWTTGSVSTSIPIIEVPPLHRSYIVRAVQGTDGQTGFPAEEIILPENVTSLNSYAFQNFSSLKRITLPNSLRTIGSYAFENCSSLTEIVIPEGVTTIDSYAFRGCTSLKKITLPSTLTSINTNAFQNCSALEAVTIPSGVTGIGQQLFDGCTSLKTVILHDGITSIGSSAFKNCSSLTALNIPPNVTSIKASAFTGCGTADKPLTLYCQDYPAPPSGWDAQWLQGAVTNVRWAEYFEILDGSTTTKAGAYAFESIIPNATYKLIKNAILKKDLVLPANTEITIDLNGYVLRGTGSNPVITNNGNLTITDSNPTRVNTYTKATYSYTHDLSGTTKITGGAVTNGKAASAGYAISNAGKLVINGGIYTGNNSSSGSIIRNSGTMTVNTAGVYGTVSTADSATTEIHGGYYNTKPAGIIDTHYYTANTATDETFPGTVFTYVVTHKPPVQKTVNTTVSNGDETLLYTIENNATYKLYSNVVLSQNIEIASNITATIDLNGFILRGTGLGSVITNNGNLTLTDSNPSAPHKYRSSNNLYNLSESATTGYIELYGGAVLGGCSNMLGGGVYNLGTFTMTGGSIVGNIAAVSGGGVYNHNNGTFTMTGGQILGNTVSQQVNDLVVCNIFTMTGGGVLGPITEEASPTITISGGYFGSALTEAWYTGYNCNSYTGGNPSYPASLYKYVVE